MKAINFEAIDSEIHQRVYGSDARVPAYTRQSESARATVEHINNSGLYKIYVKQVVPSRAGGEPDWQCEVFSADGLDNLWTEIDSIEMLAICRAIQGADIQLKAYLSGSAAASPSRGPSVDAAT